MLGVRGARQPEFVLLRLTRPVKTTERSCVGREKQLLGLPSPGGARQRLPELGRPPNSRRVSGMLGARGRALSLRPVSAELLLSGKLGEYGVIVPFSADCQGRFLSHVVSGDAVVGIGEAACPPAPRPSRRRAPRSPLDESARRRGAGGRLLYFNVTVFGKELHLRLRPNRRLVPPGAVAEWQEDFEVLFREPLQQRCLFTGDISGMPGAAVAISNCDGLVSLRPVGWFVHAACVLGWFSLKRWVTVS